MELLIKIDGEKTLEESDKTLTPLEDLDLVQQYILSKNKFFSLQIKHYAERQLQLQKQKR